MTSLLVFFCIQSLKHSLSSNWFESSKGTFADDSLRRATKEASVAFLTGEFKSRCN